MDAAAALKRLELKFRKIHAQEVGHLENAFSARAEGRRIQSRHAAWRQHPRLTISAETHDMDSS